MIKTLNKTSYNKGFTLAETLIALVVIGVVAALTIPNMFVNHQKEETVTKLKKTYSTLSQITNKAIADYGPIKSWEVENDKAKEFVDKYMAPYLNVVHNCGYESTGDCSFIMRQLKNPKKKAVFDPYYKLVLGDGTALFIKVTTRDLPRGDVVIPQAFATLYIDLNGQKGPNIIGKDIFLYVYHIKNDLTPSGGRNLSGILLPNGGTLAAVGDIRDELKEGCNKNAIGSSCAALIMADNWEIKDDYPW